MRLTKTSATSGSMPSPNPFEKCMTLSIGDLKFLDSFARTASSLAKLVEHVYDPSDNFRNFTVIS